MKNNLVNIAEKLIEIKKERDFIIPEALKSRYPIDSKGIIIEENKYIVLNTQDSSQVSEYDKVQELKEELKYNPAFYFGTVETDEPDIIDEGHNKSKLIDEAYKEVSFLQKDFATTLEFDPDSAKNALSKVLIPDKTKKGKNDFTTFSVNEKKYINGTAYDSIYCCRCIFYDISGNESVGSLLIKAYKVSNDDKCDYVYKVIDDITIQDELEKLDKKDNNNNSNYSNVNQEEYEAIKKNIQAGIQEYYSKNKDKFYRLISVKIKAIYSLRFEKTPVIAHLKIDESTVAEWSTYYSKIAGNLNIFSCPNCKKDSESFTNGKGMSIHVDHDFKKEIDLDGTNDFAQNHSPIGCGDCMERCTHCGAWHFKTTEYDNVLSSYTLEYSRKFLKNLKEDPKNKGKETYHSSDYCRCKEYLTWVYDEMSVDSKGRYYENVIGKFLTNACDLVFINDLTGEKIASYSDFILYLYHFLYSELKNEPKAQKELIEKSSNNKNSEENIKKAVHEFVYSYLYADVEYNWIELDEMIKEAIIEFKWNLSKELNIVRELIKMTAGSNISQCKTCGSYFYNKKNSQNEIYYKTTKEMCVCCKSAEDKNLKFWSRMDNGTLYYKPKNEKNAIKTIQTKYSEEIYDDWLKKSIKKIINKKASEHN